MFTSMFRSDKADIVVYFTTGTPDHQTRELPRFLPGETVTGYVEIKPVAEIKYQKIMVRMKWHTEGRGDMDSSQWAEITEPAGTTHAGITQTIPFSYVLPNEPWSFSGHYITIVWGIDVELDVSWQANPRHFAPFVLAPEWASGEPDSSPPRVKPSER